MSLKHVWILIKTEVLHGPKDILLAMAIVMPVLMSLFVNLAFGNIFTDRAELGIFDQGNSAIMNILADENSINLRTYQDEYSLKQATASGKIDMGIVLPVDFDASLPHGTVKFEAYVWGESLARNREIIPIVLSDAVRLLNSSELPVEIDTIALGDQANIPWSDRLLPMVVLMGVFYSGLMVPASSLIHEKQRRTLEALNVTPATVGDIFLAKGTIAVTLATFMGIMTIILSGALNERFLPVILVLFLGAIMATEIGLIVGAYVNDINSLFAVLKIVGILLFGPAVVYMFPQIPAWVGYLFPTYYMVRPVSDLAVFAASFGDVVIYVAVLVVFVIIGAAIVFNIIRRLSTRALNLNA